MHRVHTVLYRTAFMYIHVDKGLVPELDQGLVFEGTLWRIIMSTARIQQDNHSNETLGRFLDDTRFLRRWNLLTRSERDKIHSSE